MQAFTRRPPYHPSAECIRDTWLRTRGGALRIGRYEDGRFFVISATDLMYRVAVDRHRRIVFVQIAKLDGPVRHPAKALHQRNSKSTTAVRALRKIS